MIYPGAYFQHSDLCISGILTYRDADNIFTATFYHDNTLQRITFNHTWNLPKGWAKVSETISRHVRSWTEEYRQLKLDTLLYYTNPSIFPVVLERQDLEHRLNSPWACFSPYTIQQVNLHVAGMRRREALKWINERSPVPRVRIPPTPPVS